MWSSFVAYGSLSYITQCPGRMNTHRCLDSCILYSPIFMLSLYLARVRMLRGIVVNVCRKGKQEFHPTFLKLIQIGPTTW